MYETALLENETIFPVIHSYFLAIDCKPLEGNFIVHHYEMFPSSPSLFCFLQCGLGRKTCKHACWQRHVQKSKCPTLLTLANNGAQLQF